jgi:exodeoxyribonuclease VII large subunit
MEQMALFDASTRWTVSELTRHIRLVLEADADLQEVWVQGEISNLSRPSSGHVYFTLKDATASLRCVMWKGEAARMRFSPQDGMAVEAHGRLGVYEVAGQYQLYTDSLRPLGEGALWLEFTRLKAMLEKEGFFDPAHKRPIPPSARRIGIVTSPTGAALRDMLHTLQRRIPLAEVILAPAAVQGDEAAPALAKAIMDLNRLVAPEVILLARGGGSMEDLWAFNDERVVRAIFNSQVPVITGVGHETDFTLADFAADLRAPTPTAAAELAVATTVEGLHQSLTEMLQNLAEKLAVLFTRKRQVLEGLQSSLRFYSPQRQVQTERQRVDDLTRRGSATQSHRLALAVARLAGMENRLVALNPMGVLQRGFAVVSVHKRVVTSRLQVQPGDDLSIRVRDGDFDARVTGNG